jgi:hypothetical protein
MGELRTMKKLVLWLVLTIFLSLEALSLELPSTMADFRGQWLLDKKASDSMEPLLEAQGIPSFERRVYCHLTVTLQIEQSKESLKIRFKTPVASDEEEVKTDLTVQEREVPYIGKVAHQSEWLDGGKVLVTHTEVKSSKQMGTVQRYLEDKGQTLINLVTLTTADGRVLKAKRVFRKIAPKKT